MRRWIVLGLLALVIPGYGYGQQHLRVNSPTKTDNAPAIAQSIWKRFASEEGRFSVLFPGSPEQLSRAVPYAAGQSTEFRMFFVERKSDAIVYAVAYNDFPIPASAINADVMQQALDSGRDAMLTNLKATLLSERPIQLGNHPGRELLFKLSGNARGRIRLYFVGTRLYQVWSIVDANRQKHLTKSIEGFLNSFALLPQ